MVCTPTKSSTVCDKSKPPLDYKRMKQKYTTRPCKLSMKLKDLAISNDMSVSDLRRRQTEAEKNVNRLRNVMPEKLTTFAKMHLSFLLELDGSKLEDMFLEADADTAAKKKPATPFSSSKKKEKAVGGALSKETVNQVYKLVNYLQKHDNLKTEGLFRKTGNISRQRLLKDWIVQGSDLNLRETTFSPHDIATVLKQMLADLPEPLLTQKHFEAYMQIGGMVRQSQTERERSRARGKQLKALQLMTLLLPRENAILLEALLDLLHTAAHTPDNKMSASSLGVVFAPSLLCPRKMSAEELHQESAQVGTAVATMIENAPQLFTVPRELSDDVANFWREMENPNAFDAADNTSSTADNKENEDRANIHKAKYGSSSAVNTVLTFVERKSPEEYSSANDTQVALAKLYAHVQAMPESAKKKKLLKQFNRAGGVTPSGESEGQRKKGKHVRSRTFGESLKKHFPLLSKSKHHHQQRESCDDTANTSDVAWSITKPIIIDDTVANISYTKTPDNKYRPVLRHSPAVHIVDLGTSPCNVKPKKRLSDECIDSQVTDAKLPHLDKEITYLKKNTPCKTLFPSTPLRAAEKPVAMVSPITKSVKKMPESTKKAMMTPRSRMPMLIIKSPNLNYTESVL